ncbi:MAG: TetR/AcrR family transcriptional regulator [Planctomycetes bacterium]|nr:TetR/AcrR family transcriptional regulator [Planctomycetota bacterium]
MKTKEKILHSASYLFAMNGKDSVGIRKIAERSGVSVNTVMYHFTSKDNLYLCAMLHQLSKKIPHLELLEPLADCETCAFEDAPDRIAISIKNIFDFFLEENRAEQANFLLQAIFTKDENIAQSLMQSFEPFDIQFISFFERVGIEYDKPTIMFVFYVLWSQLLYNVTAKSAIVADMDGEEPTGEYYYDVGKRITEVFCQQLKLPPHDVGIWLNDNPSAR